MLPIPRTPEKKGQGFVLPAAIFLLVVLGGLAAWMLRLTQTTLGQEALAIEGERAYRAAAAGLEAGIYAARQSGADCDDISQSVTFPGQLARFTASVYCIASSADEAGTTINFFEINSIACNQPSNGVCPNSTPTLPEYAERRMRAVVEAG
jgi:MSHA biogenesis protein MshP